MKLLGIGLLLFVFFNAIAIADQKQAHGFHWYRIDSEKKIPLKQPIKKSIPTAVNQSPYEELLSIRKKTLDKLARAIIHPSFDATYEYMKSQQAYAIQNQKFVRFWQEVLIMHPELDHTLNYPTNNTAIAIKNDEKNNLIERILHSAKDNYGLIFYYNGKNPFSDKFSNQLLSFIKTYSFSLISVSTDGVILKQLPDSKVIPLRAIQTKMDLQSRYMPALFLVNLKTQKMSPLSYGFLSVTELKERFLDVATHYKRFSYEGLSEE